MKRFPSNFIVLMFLLSASFWLAGCNGRPTPEVHEQESEKHQEKAEPEHHDEGEGAGFVEGKGLRLPEEMKTSLGLEIQTATQSNLRTQITETAQVYRGAGEKTHGNAVTRLGFAYASAMVSVQDAKLMARGQKVELQPLSGAADTIQGRILDFDKQLEPFSEHWEVIIEIPDVNKRCSVGTFLKAVFPSGRIHNGLVIPKTALLEAAEGNFVYVAKEQYLARSPVTVGGVTSEGVEITTGLQPGDRIVVKPVETLWLIELRLVKGGGHAD